MLKHKNIHMNNVNNKIFTQKVEFFYIVIILK